MERTKAPEQPIYPGAVTKMERVRPGAERSGEVRTFAVRPVTLATLRSEVKK